MKTKYEIELADNGMVVRRRDIGVVCCFEYLKDEKKKLEPIANWLGGDILDDMLESPDIRKELKCLMQETVEDGVDNFEISVEIKPIIK